MTRIYSAMKKPYTSALFILMRLILLVGFSVLAYLTYKVWFIDKITAIIFYCIAGIFALVSFLSYKANKE